MYIEDDFKNSTGLLVASRNCIYLSKSITLRKQIHDDR